MALKDGDRVSSAEQTFSTTVISLANIGVYESEVPIDVPSIIALLKDFYIAKVPHFSTIMVADENGEKKWKTVEVNLNNHVKIPVFPSTGEEAASYYDKLFDEYLSKVAMEQLPPSQPLWDIHLFNYPTSHAAATILFKHHQALGDGYSFMTALLESFRRADNPSLPLTLPSVKPRSFDPQDKNNSFNSTVCVPADNNFSSIIDTVSDFSWSFNKIHLVEDDKTPIRSGKIGVEFRPLDISIISFSLEDITQIKGTIGATVNDVITATIFLGTRKYMEAMDKKSSDSDSTSLVVLNTRQSRDYGSMKDIMVKQDNNADSSWGNRITFLYVPIPKLTDMESLHDPLDIVKNVHEIIKKKRSYSSLQLFVNHWIQDTLKESGGPEAGARYLHRTLKNTSMGISNLIGPREKIAFAGHPIKRMYFYPSGSPQNLTITMLSYLGRLNVALEAEKGFIDTPKWKACVESAFEVLLKAATLACKIPKKN